MADEIQPNVGALQIHHETATSPDIYFNGIEIGLTLSDISVTATMDGQTQCKLHMSFTTAKTLATELSSAVAEFERLTDHSIMTMSEVQEGLKKVQDK